MIKQNYQLSSTPAATDRNSASNTNNPKTNKNIYLDEDERSLVE